MCLVTSFAADFLWFWFVWVFVCVGTPRFIVGPSFVRVRFGVMFVPCLPTSLGVLSISCWGLALFIPRKQGLKTWFIIGAPPDCSGGTHPICTFTLLLVLVLAFTIILVSVLALG